MRDPYKNKKIGIFGLGITGASLYKKLLPMDCDVICYDDNEEKRDAFVKEFTDQSIKNLMDHLWTDLDFIVVSPGIPNQYPSPHRIFYHAARNNIDILSDIDLLYLENPDKVFVAITGTNGKSSVTHMVTHILRSNGRNFTSCGNIGKSVMSVSNTVEGYIIELSSFQLDIIQYLKPNIACITNITDDHLDRYENVDAYIASKLKLFRLSIGPNILGINSKYTTHLDLSNIRHCKKLPIGGNITETNCKYASVICSYLGVKESESINALKTYRNLAHRMEYIGRYNNLQFFNDSKATNIDATIAGIAHFINIFLLAGGVSKSDDYALLVPYLHRIKKAYLFGENKYIIASFLSGKIEYEIFENMPDALHKAQREGQEETQSINIILSPMSSSFDQFKNFEARGRQFTALCRQSIEAQNAK